MRIILRLPWTGWEKCDNVVIPTFNYCHPVVKSWRAKQICILRQVGEFSEWSAPSWCVTLWVNIMLSKLMPKSTCGEKWSVTKKKRKNPQAAESLPLVMRYLLTSVQSSHALCIHAGLHRVSFLRFLSQLRSTMYPLQDQGHISTAVSDWLKETRVWWISLSVSIYTELQLRN